MTKVNNGHVGGRLGLKVGIFQVTLFFNGPNVDK